MPIRAANSHALKILPRTSHKQRFCSRSFSKPVVFIDHRGGGYSPHHRRLSAFSPTTANRELRTENFSYVFISKSMPTHQSQRHAVRIARPAPQQVLFLSQALADGAHPAQCQQP